MVGSRDVFYSRPAFASFLPAAILTCRVKHSTFEATGEMDKEERKIINKGQEDEMVTSFHDFLGSKKMQLKKSSPGRGPTQWWSVCPANEALALISSETPTHNIYV